MKVALACAAIGFACAWGIQSLRWSESDAQAAKLSAEAIAANVNAMNAHLQAAQAETEKYRAEYLESQAHAKAEIDDLERRVTAGPERLYIKATCPAVPATGADASGVGSGAAELDPAATRAYFDLERGLAKQYGLLQLCRRELRKRSQQKAP